MATLGAGVLTLLDHAKRTDPNGKVAVIAELLDQDNEITTDMLMMEANNGTSHQLTVRTGLPTVVWRLLNQGVPPSKSTTAQIEEATGMLEGWSEVDKDLAEKNGDVNAFRMSEAQPFTEAMSQEMVRVLFYGNSALDPEQFTGLATRYSSLTATIGRNIIDGGGTGSDNMSVWLICWHPQGLFGVFPQGTEMGLVHNDLGLGVIQTATGIGTGRMLGYRERWQWKIGVAVKDWRSAARIANIDTSNLVGESSATDLTKSMILATHKIKIRKNAPCAFYMNPTAFQMLDIQRYNNTNAATAITYEAIDGKRIPFFRGIPIRITDQLVETEATVS